MASPAQQGIVTPKKETTGTTTEKKIKKENTKTEPADEAGTSAAAQENTKTEPADEAGTSAGTSAAAQENIKTEPADESGTSAEAEAGAQENTKTEPADEAGTSAAALGGDQENIKTEPADESGTSAEAEAGAQSVKPKTETNGTTTETKIKTATFIICGNMNAYIEDDQKDFEETTLETRKFQVQNSAEQYQTEHGKNLLDFCRATGFRIVNGRFGGTSGNWTTKGKHVYEYVLCRNNLDWGHIDSLEVGVDDHDSKRYPLTLTLKYTCDCADQSEPGIALECSVRKMDNLQVIPDVDDIIWGLEPHIEVYKPAHLMCTYSTSKRLCVRIKNDVQYSFLDISHDWRANDLSKFDVLLSVAPKSAPLPVKQIFCFNVNDSEPEQDPNQIVTSAKQIVTSADQIVASAHNVLSYCEQKYPESKIIYKCLLTKCDEQTSSVLQKAVDRQAVDPIERLTINVLPNLQNP